MILTKKRKRNVGITIHTLYIESISCFQQKNAWRKDFVYIRVEGGKPGKTLVGIIGCGETKQLSAGILLSEGKCRLELWKKDTIATDDQIGVIDLAQYKQEIPQEVTIRNEATCYKLGFRLVTTV